MAEKYGQIWKTDHIKPLTDYRLDKMSSEKSNILVILADFSPCRYEVSQVLQTQNCPKAPSNKTRVCEDHAYCTGKERTGRYGSAQGTSFNIEY